MEMWLVGSIDMNVRPLAMQDKIEGEKERVSWGPLYSFLKLIFLNSCVLVTQSCLFLCNPMDSRPPGSSIHGIFQARILEWVAIPSPGHLLTQGSNLHLLHWQANSLPLSHQGSPSYTLVINKSLALGFSVND